jgi:competence protein ComEC
MTVSKVLLYFCLVFIGGIFLNSIIFVSRLYMLGFLISGLILISVFWKYPVGPRPQPGGGANGAGKKLVVAGFCLLFLVLGAWRHQAAELQSLKSELRNYNDREIVVTLTGIITKEPDIREKSIKLTINNLIIKTEDGPLSAEGKVLVTTWRYPEYQYGDKLRIAGKLETPQVFGGFNYRDYLKKEGIYSLIYFPEIEVLDRGLGNPLMRVLFSFKNKFQESAQKFLSPPQEGILEALVFGEEANISQEWKDKLNLTGTRHITAVSGMNTTIIGFIILSFALSIGLWRHHSFYLSLFILLLYILMIGAPPSAVRAGIMAALLMAAQYFGRLSLASRAVLFAATIMLFFNPLLLRLDVGFQLSFLAILGLVYLQPAFFRYLKKIPNPKFFPIRMTLSATLAAQIFTLPILVYNFGRIPLLSPIANVLIVPLLAPFTILFFVFGIGSMIFWLFGFFLSFPTWISLTYIVKIVDFFSKIPFVSLALENVHWFWLIISYLILGYFAWRLQEKQKLKFLNY